MEPSLLRDIVELAERLLHLQRREKLARKFLVRPSGMTSDEMARDVQERETRLRWSEWAGVKRTRVH